MKTLPEKEHQKMIHVKGLRSRPIKQGDGTWTTVIEDYEEDIPDLGRAELICNSCGFPAYPKCKENCTAWVYKTMDNLKNK